MKTFFSSVVFLFALALAIVHAGVMGPVAVPAIDGPGEATKEVLLEEQLNKVLVAVTEDPEFKYLPTVNREGVMESHNQWLIFNKDTLEFLKQLYPDLDPEPWEIWLKQNRIEALSLVLDPPVYLK